MGQEGHKRNAKALYFVTFETQDAVKWKRKRKLSSPLGCAYAAMLRQLGGRPTVPQRYDFLVHFLFIAAIAKNA